MFSARLLPPGIALCLFARAVAAATLLHLELVPDGSAEPPGDRLEMSIALARGEDRVQLQVRALSVVGLGEQDVQLVAGRRAPYRGEDGRFRIRKTVDRPAGSGRVPVQLVVPYDALELGPGTYRLAYEVRGLVGGQTVFVQATRLTRLVVTDQVRRRLELVRHAEQLEPVQRQARVMIMEGGKLREQTMLVRRFRRVRRPTVNVHQVAIRGGFVRSEIQERPRGGEPDPTQPAAMLADFQPKQKRVIAFATNRNLIENGEGKQPRFAAEVSDHLTFGAARVNIPIHYHVLGKLEVPKYNWWQRRPPDPQRHFLVEALQLWSRRQLAGHLSPQDNLLFIHGYNNTLEAALLRTAQLQHDLQLPGTAMTFSWPSAGKALQFGGGPVQQAYMNDERRAADSVAACGKLLRLLIDEHRSAGKGRTHVIAHSLGNRVLLGAAAWLVSNAPAGWLEGGGLGHVVLAAPDVSASQFEQGIGPLQRIAKSVTYYYSFEDVVLSLSEGLHNAAPIGLAPVMVRGVDTINADNANELYFGLGHGYYAASSPMLDDLRLILLLSFSPEQRQPPLAPKTMLRGLPHWSFLLPPSADPG